MFFSHLCVMKKLGLFLLAVFLPMLAGCALEDSPQIENADPETGRVRSLEEALQNLDTFISNNYPATKSSNWPKIKNSSNYRESNLATKSTGQTGKSDGTLAYIVNFEDNEGFAVLGAHTTIDDIVVLAESGNIDTLTLKVTFGKLILSSEDEEDETESERDTTGFYCAEDDDFYCADTDTTTLIIGELIRNGLGTVNDGEEDPGPVDDDNQTNKPNTSTGGNNGNSGSGKGSSGSSTSSFQFHTCNPLLAYSWGQKTPYNNYCYRNKAKGKHAYTGCSNTALSMIMVHVGYPENFYINNWKMEWAQMRINIKKDSTSTAAYNIARLLGVNFKNVHKWVTRSFTLITPRQIEKRLEQVGYADVTRMKGRNYTYNMITATSDMLKKGYPVFISAIPKKWSKGHSWVIDGAKYSTESKYLVHCNFGWKGLCNGYFSTSCLNPSRADSYDNFTGDEKNSNYTYNWHFRVITYEKGNVTTYAEEL